MSDRINDETPGGSPGVSNQIQQGREDLTEVKYSMDRGQANLFLQTLDPTADAFTFQCFTDKGQECNYPPAIFNGTLEQHWAELEQRNLAGQGVFVTINQTDLTGRKLENITAVRAVYQEDDGGHGAEGIPLAMGIRVNSSPGKYHRYVLVNGPDPLAVSEARGVEEHLVEHWGSDPSAKDVSRVLRLPGFYNRKSAYGAGFRVTLEYASREQCYTWEQIKTAFPPRLNGTAQATQQTTQTTAASFPAPYFAPQVEREKVWSALASIHPTTLDYHQWVTILMALHSLNTRDGYDFAVAWSSSDPTKFQGELEISKKWASFDLMDTGVGIGTLFYMAEERGWGTAEPQGPMLSDTGNPVAAAVIPPLRVWNEGCGLLEREALIPPRRWVLKGLLQRMYIAGLAGPGGTGKTVFGLTMACAVASGKNLLGLGELEKTPVIVVSNEDDMEEVERRLAAIMKAHRLTGDDLKDLHVVDGYANPFRVALSSFKRGEVVAGGQVNMLKELILSTGAGLVVVDPFVSLHTCNENDNGEMEKVVSIMRNIVAETKVAMMVIHHTGKPDRDSEAHAGLDSAFRGASSVTSALRSVCTLATMNQTNAKDADILECDRRRYFRFDTGKNNFSPPGDHTVWYKLETIHLANGDFVGVPMAKPEIAEVIAIVKQHAGEEDKWPMERRVKMVRLCFRSEPETSTTRSAFIKNYKEVWGVKTSRLKDLLEALPWNRPDHHQWVDDSGIKAMGIRVWRSKTSKAKNAPVWINCTAEEIPLVQPPGPHVVFPAGEM